jgi:hypothetical protein
MGMLPISKGPAVIIKVLSPNKVSPFVAPPRFDTLPTDNVAAELVVPISIELILLFVPVRTTVPEAPLT